jgi:hypothetical protein
MQLTGGEHDLDRDRVQARAEQLHDVAHALKVQSALTQVEAGS